MKVKKSKKYADGGPLQPKPKKKAAADSVPSEMFPGKMIPRSQSNYETGEYAKMLSGSKSAPKKSAPVKKAAVPKKKMKDGGKSFPDLNKDGKITKADILKGRGVIKNGGKLKKQAAKAIAMKKAGKAPKKAMGGMKMGKCKYGC